MSLTSVCYTCSQCEFSDVEGFAIQEYQGAPEREPQLRRVWCKQCDAITMGLFPYLAAHTNPIVEESIQYIEFLQSSFFYRFSKKKKTEVNELEKIIAKEENAMMARINYFKNNPSKGKCLLCASQEIYVLKPFKNYMKHYFSLSELPPEPTGVIHSCGGEILVATGARFYMGSNYKYPVISYNEHGTIIVDG